MQTLKRFVIMDSRKLIPIVAMVSVLIFFVWGWLDTFQRSWIIFIVAGIAIVALSIFGKEKQNN